MTSVPEFHASGSGDGDELVFHNQAECVVGQALKKSGMSLPGQGYYRTLCRECKAVSDGPSRPDPF
jgi:predicted nucleic acid-binding Zn ribbon protein